MFTSEYLRELTNKAIASLGGTPEAERLFEPVRYILSIGGKRLRPVMCLLSCNIFSDKIDEAVMPAVGIEVFHNFTLIHDDIIDKDEVRRGSPTVHAKWGPDQAVLSGDVMAFIAMECIGQAPERALPKVLKLFNRTAIEVCTGQQLDLDFEKKGVVSEAEYLRMIELKTAVLIAASLKTGAIIGDASEKDQDLLYEFGRCLGIAFQIQDDVLDTYGDTKLFGKKTGSDIVANKKTYLLVKAFEMAGGSMLTRLRELLGPGSSDPEAKVRGVRDIYDELEIRLQAENLAYDYFNRAFQALDQVSANGERKSELKQLSVNLIGRVK
ncbi:MAG TPA: polyprenyl synthetase family protein [Bacteroidales bacterium]|jgi:geranylgeranyl diphosphate synthase type II|nr:polyprenyl synthetase family protein [Bacteroidales bacterium]MDI9533404.1 polyprenyl synthetase family protein [Bacteroidota bacterium]OPZ57447.1 MAG: (2E,6E)-farnesyl diphosphate synthase [Bacteroidetes bacterium ADurb.BinA012]MBK7732790.1 polyprenyl synthetase family protein [Bacteroidales bacterium]MBP7035889.1 polyprenyl synthetase family protein [Bacteroidales bacterium]